MNTPLSEQLVAIANHEESLSPTISLPGKKIAVLREAATTISALVAALEIAEQFMSIATDWNFDEAEIDGKMQRTSTLLKTVRAALAKAGA
jgi:hypothetical protein